jgi:hypothetical protein
LHQLDVFTSQQYELAPISLEHHHLCVLLARKPEELASATAMCLDVEVAFHPALKLALAHWCCIWDQLAGAVFKVSSS